MKNSLAILSCILAASLCASAQKVLYTLKAGESMIMEDYLQLPSIHGAFSYMLFTERGKQKYAIYNGKEYGPFNNIYPSDMSNNSLEWSVMKDSMFYQLILDKGQLLGPYENADEVYRNYNPLDPANDQSHYGFKAKKGGQWYIVVDGKEWGPYPEPDRWTPIFSTDGTNWVAQVNDDFTKFFVASGKGPVPANAVPINTSFRGNDFFTEVRREKGGFVFEGDSISISHRASSSVGVKCGTRTITSESYSYYELLDMQGNVVETANELATNWKGPNFMTFYAKYTLYDDRGQPVQIIHNSDIYTDMWQKGCSYTGIPVVNKIVKEYFTKVNEQVLGPFKAMSNYGGLGYVKGKYAFVANPGGQLVIDGKPTSTKGVKYVSYNSNTGSTLCELHTGEMVFNEQVIGKFGEGARPILDEQSDQYSIIHQKNDKPYVYVSVAKKSIGPFETEAPLIVFSADKLHWGYIDQRKVYIDGVVKAQQGFDLVYDPQTKAFKWITVKDKQILLNEFKTL